MNDSLGSLVFDLGAELAPFARQLGQARGMVSSFAGSVGGMFRQAFAFAGGQMLVSTVSNAVGRMTGLVQQGIAYNAMIEGTTASFEVMTGSLATAKKMLGELTTLAAQTPFQLPQLTSAATQLMATKEIAQDELLPTIKKLGDAAAGSAEGFDALPRVVRAVSQMLGKGKVTGEEMMQLAEAGIPAWSALSDEMGISVAQLQKMSSQGKLGKDVVIKLIDALGNRFKGMADKQSKTFTGLWSTITDNFNAAIGKLTKPIFDRLKPAFEQIVKIFDSDAFNETITKLAAGIEYVVSLIESGLQNPLVQAGLKFAAVLAATVSIGAAIAAVQAGIAAISPILAGVVVPAIAMSAAIAGVALLVKRAFAGPEGPQFIAKLQEIWRLIVEIGVNIRDFFVAAFREVAGPMEDVLSSTGSIQQGFNRLLDSALEWIRWTLDGISVFTTNWVRAWNVAQAAVGYAINYMRDLFVYVMNEVFPHAINAWIDAGDAGFRSMIESWRTIFDAFITYGDTLFTSFLMSLSEKFKYIQEGLKAALSGKLGDAASILVGGVATADANRAVRDAQASKEFGKDIAPVVSGVAAKMAEAIKNAMGGMEEFTESDVTKKFGASLGKMWAGLTEMRNDIRRVRGYVPPGKKPGEKPGEDAGGGGGGPGKPPPIDEKKLGKAEFVGLAELNKRMQTALGGDKEAQARKAQVEAVKEVAKNQKEAMKDFRENLEVDKKILAGIESKKFGFTD